MLHSNSISFCVFFTIKMWRVHTSERENKATKNIADIYEAENVIR